MEFKRLFTVEGANSTLPLVRQIVGDILETAQRIATLEEGDEDLSALETRLEEHERELEELGCFYKDWSFSVGLVDFPCEIDGEVVFLCWRSDEESLSWYHRIEDGYRGRQRLPLLA